MDLATALHRTIQDATPHSKAVFGGPNAMSDEEVAAFITEYPVGLVCTADASGTPHVTGKAVVLLDGKIFSASSGETAMGRNLRRNRAVALAFAEPPWKRHVLVQGSVRFLDEGSEEERGVGSAHAAAHGWEPAGLAEVVVKKIFTWKD